MKKIKFVLCVFVITCISSALNIKADSYLGFAGITIPAAYGTYTTDYVNKTTESNQYIKKIAAIDSASGDERTIEARLQGVTTKYVRTEKGKYVQLFSDNAGLGQTAGKYKLTLKAETWLLTTSKFSGSWVLDDYLL